MTGTVDFVNPPIVELALGAQFSLLTKLSAGHFGLFWKELGSEWTDPADGPLIDDQYELFDRPRLTGPQLRLQKGRYPERFTLGHRDQDRLLQIQSTRFCLNWRKRQGFYPSFTKLIGEFEARFNQFKDFADRERLGTLLVNQWELTYIDAFPKGEYWDSPGDWANFLPGLFGNLFATEGLGVALEHRASEWSYEIQPRRGRLHISVVPGRINDDERDAVLLTMTARGPVGKAGAESLRAGLDLGHTVAFGAFMRVVSGEAKRRWEAKP